MTDAVEEQVVGWRELDPDGNVVRWGPPIVLEMVSALGEPDPVEPDVDTAGGE